MPVRGSKWRVCPSAATTRQDSSRAFGLQTPRRRRRRSLRSRHNFERGAMGAKTSIAQNRELHQCGVCNPIDAVWPMKLVAQY